jgi:hypothetical protein
MANSFSPNYLNNIFQQSIVQGPTGPTSAIDLVGMRNITTKDSNITINGDGNETGSLGAQYITLPDLNGKQETYIWAEKNTLLWQPFIGTNPPGATDLIGWVPKLEQTLTVPILDPITTTLPQLVTSYNNLVGFLYQKKLVFKKPQSNPQTYNLYANPISLKPIITTPYTNTYQNVFSINNSIWTTLGITRVDQIENINLNFYSEIFFRQLNPGSFFMPSYNIDSVLNSLNVSDARLTFSSDDSKISYYAYHRRVTPNTPNVTAIGSHDISVPTNTQTIIPQNNYIITSQDTLQNLLGGKNGDPNLIDTTKGINIYFFISSTPEPLPFVPRAHLTNSKLTGFVINYYN